MRPDLQIFLSGCLTFGVPLVYALRELFLLKRDRGPGWQPDPPPETPQKPLPPCLLEALKGAPSKPDLELV